LLLLLRVTRTMRACHATISLSSHCTRSIIVHAAPTPLARSLTLDRIALPCVPHPLSLSAVIALCQCMLLIHVHEQTPAPHLQFDTALPPHQLRHVEVNSVYAPFFSIYSITPAIRSGICMLSASLLHSAIEYNC